MPNPVPEHPDASSEQTVSADIVGLEKDLVRLRRQLGTLIWMAGATLLGVLVLVSHAFLVR